MKSKIRKRLLALMLCIAMVVNGSGSVLADDGTLLEEQEVVSEEAVEIVEETEEVVEEETIVEEEIEEVAVEEVVEETPITLDWSEDGVTVTVTEKVAGAIPEGTTLSVTPIVEGEEYTAVETGLQEKAANEEYELAGFLAYDICLVDAAGNEIEPNDNVNVSIEYDEAVIPEMEVAKDAALDVTVMHFEEDANGIVTEIVDMVADEKAEATVTTTASVEVEKAEFVTDGFSTFTITWTSTESSEDGSVENRTIEGTVVTVTGSTFTVSDRVINLTNIDSDILRIGDINFENINQNGTTYVFNKAVVCQGSYSSAAAINVVSINYYNGTYRANNNENYVITNDASGYSLYFVYLKQNTISTVDSKAENIKISLFDYTRFDSKTYNHDKILESINTNHPLKFATNGQEFSDPLYNRWTGNGGGPRQGMVNYNLDKDGFPYLKQSGTTAGESLGYLFNDNDVEYDANYLFTKQGAKFVYDSATNFAELDTSTNNFTVYDSPKVGFFPFNYYTDDISVCSASEGSSGNSGGSWYPGYYPGFGSSADDTNHHFGMHVEFNFMQPYEGRVDGNDMIFKFSGDDDVWVYIDGMLVLDLGGIHEKTGGTINFATGEVIYEHGNTQNSTIREMFINAFMEDQNINRAAAEVLADEYFEAVNIEGTTYYRFKNYSQYKLDFFYLERGAHDSNCYLEFNLIPVPEDAVTIEKEISNYADGAYSDVEFFFKVYLQNGEKDTVPGTPKNANDVADTLMTVDAEGEPIVYEHIAVDGTRTNKTLGTDGVFKLKHKEQAVFSHLSVNTQFYVVETGLDQKEYDKVEIIGSGVLNEAGSNIEGEDQSISTKTLVIGTDHYAKFQNRCASTNMKYLSVEKFFDESAMLEGNPDYTLEVSLGGALYTGKYKVGADYDKAVASLQEYTAVEGIIKLKAGEVAVIIGYASAEDGTKGIPSGTSFKVREVDLDLQSYVPPKYEVTKADAIETVNTKNGWASGKINIDKNAHVKVTNALRQAADSSEIKVSKTFSGLTEEQLNTIAQQFNITVESKDITPAISTTLLLSRGVKSVEENGDITFTWTLLNYPAGTYVVKENNEVVEQFENVITINGDVVASSSNKEVTTTAATINYSQSVKIDSNVQGEYTVGNVNIIVAQLTDDAGYFVWTRDRISVNERLAIIDLINNQVKFTPVASLNNCYFYSRSISDTLVFRDGEITYDGIQKLTFDTTSTQWSAFVTGIYEIEGGDKPEIVVKNTYTPSTIDVDLRKTTVKGIEIDGAEFTLYEYSTEGTGSWGEVKTVTILNDATKGLELTGLATGRYKLVETKAPNGFILLDKEIFFSVENKEIILTDNNGIALSVNPDMWTLDKANKVLTIENDFIYELPQSGGFGIYMYMIGGMMLMAFATFVLYKNRRKEVLAR